MTGWRDARRILAIRLDAMGDLLMTEPAIRALAGRRAHVTLLTSPAGAALAPMLPVVSDTIAYEAPWMKASARRADPAADHGLIARLRDRAFDGAVIFTVHTQSALPAALVCHLAGIPLRAAHCRENPYQLLTDWVPESEPAAERHEVERQLALVERLGFAAGDDDIRIGIPPRAVAAARVALLDAGIDLARPWIALHPGASAPSRRYPVDRYAAAVAALAEGGWQAAILGGPDDLDAADELERLAEHPAVVSLAGRLDVAELAATIGLASVFVGNNSGPAHIAAAVGTPSVVLYALTNPQHTPWRVPSRVLSHDVPCRNCLRSVCPLGHNLCLRGIGAEEIVSAVAELAPARPLVAGVA